MPFKKANIDILTQIEYGGSYTTQTNLTGYKINGTDFFASAATTTDGFLYSADTYAPTGYKKNGTQIVLQKAGCRPRSATKRWASGGAGTAYIHRYSNGAVYVIAIPLDKSLAMCYNTTQSRETPCY
jgi:hypothetical protein